MSSTSKTDSPKRGPRWVLGLVLFSVGYLALAEFGRIFFPPEVDFVSFWLPSGLFVGALLCVERARWPAILALGFLMDAAFDLSGGLALKVSLLSAAGNCLEAATGAYLVRRFAAERPRLGVVREVAALVVLSAVLSTAISATFGTFTIYLTEGAHALPVVWLFWWGGNVLGVLLMAPVILTWPSGGLRRVRSALTERVLEKAAILVVTSFVCTFAFHLAPKPILPLVYPVIPCVLWAAFRFGTLGTALVNLLIAAYAAWFSTLGFHDFAVLGLEPQLRFASLQISLGIIALTGLFLAAVLSEREHSARERRDMERKLQETQKLESLGLLAGGIAHDFNNILTGILGNASLAVMEMEERDPARANMQAIQEGARRAADLCRQLLAYSGKGRFVVQNLHLDHLVDETLPLLRVSINRKIDLRFEMGRTDAPILADATQLRQVLMNLVINASEAIEPLNGLIRISTGVARVSREELQRAIVPSDLKEGMHVFLEVSDTGCGMTPETQARIFDPFFTTKFSGRGIGLSAVLGIIRGHHGTVLLTSSPGRGTVFRILFPRSEGTATPVSPERPSDASWRGTGRVLVVDDEEPVRSNASLMLKRLGFSVTTCVDGLAAVQEFRARPGGFVLVLLDLTMPQLDGEGTFLELRRIDPKVRVVLISGFSEQEAIAHFAGKGLASFLQKPFEYPDLSRVVERTLSES